MQVNKITLFLVGVIGFACGFAIIGGLVLVVGMALVKNGYSPAGLGWITLPILAGLTGSAIAKSYYLKHLMQKAQGTRQ